MVIAYCLFSLSYTRFFVRPKVSNANTKETYVQVADDVLLHTLEYGDSQSGTAPVILMLHGFPDLSLSWQYHAQRLSDEGYFVVTPDLRGFGSSSILSNKGDLDAYSGKRLVSDVDALRKHYCGEDGSFAMLVGHDWGGVVVWATLEAFGRASTDGLKPIAKSAVLVNAPHPRVFSEYIYTLKQAVKSWYIFCFQFYWFPEFFLHRTQSLYYLGAKVEYQYLVKSLGLPIINGDPTCSAKATDESSTCSSKQVKPSIDVEQNLAIFKQALTDRDRIHAMLSYYRSITAGFWSEPRDDDKSELSLVNRVIRWMHNSGNIKSEEARTRALSEQKMESTLSVSVPTMILWGKKDRFLGEELASAPHGLLENNQGTKFFDAGHWVHWEKPLEIVEELIKFANAYNSNTGEPGETSQLERFLARDGPTAFDDFAEFGDEWQIFHLVAHPRFPELCINPEDPRGERKCRLAESNISFEEAETACAPLKDLRTMKDCVYGALDTQDLDMVGAF
ncbi:MAG: hypothetical protein SGBAC_004152 [Bacillariaceae sp.]